MKRLLRWVMAIAIVGAVVYFAIPLVQSRLQDEPTNYQTVAVRQGSLVSSISATGTIEPEDLIDIGAQVAGRIVEFGRDEQGQEIDYGSRIKQGLVLAKIDDVVYRSDMRSAEAQLANARADLERAKADLGKLRAKDDQGRRDWQRAQRLGPSEALAQSSYDAYQSAYEVAEANVLVGQAAIHQAEAGVAQAQASVDRAKQNLGYCTILSPVDGVIIDRRVNIGQTVVASLNAPSLFLIAKDLRQVQIWVAVNEADIGSIHPDQPITFTVAAFPNEQFTGKVGKIRLNASMTQNVVTYTVEVITDNSSGRLLPYLTADVQFETARRENILLVPNAALRWTPPAGTERPATRPSSPDARGAGRSRPDASAKSDRQSSKQDSSKGTIWVSDNGQVRPMRVEVGITDGIDTEIGGRDVQEGANVVTGIKVGAVASAPAASTNPFVPQIRFRGGGGGGGGKR
jgi:HlyD family secretion protein